MSVLMCKKKQNPHGSEISISMAWCRAIGACVISSSPSSSLLEVQWRCVDLLWRPYARLRVIAVKTTTTMEIFCRKLLYGRAKSLRRRSVTTQAQVGSSDSPPIVGFNALADWRWTVTGLLDPQTVELMIHSVPRPHLAALQRSSR